jgi:hypothetical protein
VRLRGKFVIEAASVPFLKTGRTDNAGRVSGKATNQE